MHIGFGFQTLFQPIFCEAALFAAVGYLAIGIDEIAVDLIWLARTISQLIAADRQARPRSVDRLSPRENPEWFAVFVPARNESAVIGPMLQNALRAYSGRNIHIFVGCYSSDPETIEIARPYQGERLSVIVFKKDGRSTKAECLNEVYLRIGEHERMTKRRFAGIVLHDAEDIVNGHEIAVFDAFVDRYAMIQLPVVPIAHKRSRWISGHYCDEFAESHGKTLIVRQALGASLPSAGVGCMIRRDAIEALASHAKGRPFAEDSVTEDYEIGLRLASLGFKSAFLRVHEPGGHHVVATRAYFPGTLEGAVKQKTRWVSGIALAGWDRVGWGHGLAENWMRLRDRMSLLAAVVAAIGYFAALLGLLFLTEAYLRDCQPIAFDSLAITLVRINGLILLWRLCFRFFFTARTYGWVEGCRSLPRIAVSNVIGIIVVRRAVSRYIEQLRTGIVMWDKTEHEFPESIAEA